MAPRGWARALRSFFGPLAAHRSLRLVGHAMAMEELGEQLRVRREQNRSARLAARQPHRARTNRHHGALSHASLDGAEHLGDGHEAHREVRGALRPGET